MHATLVSTRFALSNIAMAVSGPVAAAAGFIAGGGAFIGAVQAFGDPDMAAGLTRVRVEASFSAAAKPDENAPPAEDVAALGPDDPAEHGEEAASAPPPDPATAAYAALDALFAHYEGGPVALPTAPLPGLTQAGPGGFLPAVSGDGRTSLASYARPFPRRDARPRIGVLVKGLGLSPTLTRQVIETMPGGATLAFSPYTENLQDWIDQARAAGHEVMLETPMEPFDYPLNDPGPHTLLVDADVAEVSRRLDWVMARATGYVGLVNVFGARFTTDGDAMSRVLSTARRRGVGFVYSNIAQRRRLDDIAQAVGVSYAAADEVLDPRGGGATLDPYFLRLEARALQEGHALASMRARPAAVEETARWLATLDIKGYAFAPVSLVLQERSRGRTARASAPARANTASAQAPQFTHVQAGFGGAPPDDYAGGKAKDTGKGKE